MRHLNDRCAPLANGHGVLFKSIHAEQAHGSTMLSLERFEVGVFLETLSCACLL